MTTNPLQVLLEKRAILWEQYQDTLARANKDGWTAEIRQTLDRMDEDLTEATGDINRLRKADATRAVFDAVDNTPGPGDPDQRSTDTPDPDEEYRKAFVSFLRHGIEGVPAEQRQALQAGFAPLSNEQRAQGVATTTAGGYFVPQAFRNRIVEVQKTFGAVAEVAEVITTETGATLPWPTNDDTANKGAILAENTQVTEQDVVLGQAQLGAYMYTSKLVRVSLQLLQDSAFNLETWLAGKLGQRLARATNEHFTTGTGTAQPQGIQTGAVAGVTLGTGNTTSITYDGLIDLIHSIDPAYRASGRARFMLHDTALATLRKLKDTTNAPLWQPSIQAGVPDTLLGYGITVNQDMPVPAASVKSVLFGDFFSGYVVRRVLGIQSLRLAERYADFLQVGFLAFERLDGKVQDTSAYKALVQSAT